MTRRFALLAVPCLALGCLWPQGPDARLQVELLRGFATAPVAGSASASRVEVLLDLSRSMNERTAGGPRRYLAVRRAAARFVDSLPPDAAVGLHALGIDRVAECQPAKAIVAPVGAGGRRAVRLEIDRLRVAGEGSLAAAIESVRAALAAEGTLAGARVVAFSDLGAECGGNLCSAAEHLVAGGALLDLVVIGESGVPVCLDGIVAAGGASALAMEGTEPHFYVESHRGEPVTAACGVANGLPVLVPPGDAVVVVELDPPLRVERRFDAAERMVLQVIDFPSLDPPTRRWRWRSLEEPENGETPVREEPAS